MSFFDKIEKKNDFLVGIDSDGCVFDTMEIKQKECFTPNVIKYFGMQPISKYARECCLFVNLYSQTRGINRWPALIKELDYANNRKEAKARNFKLKELPYLREWVAKEPKWSNKKLKEYIAKQTNPKAIEELTHALAWSEAVDATIKDMVYGIPPFPFVEKSLIKMRERADMLVVSQTPVEALEREWKEHSIDKYVTCIAGQEMGTKAEHLKYTIAKGYDIDKVLMIGDALGDLKSARSNNCLFYPIIPDHEEDSWERFYSEAMDRFFAGTYKGQYEEELIKEFNKYLPENPPW